MPEEDNYAGIFSGEIKKTHTDTYQASKVAKSIAEDLEAGKRSAEILVNRKK